MIVKGKDVIGLKVVTIDTGSVVQTVDDIAYEPKQQRIVALLVDSGGIFSSTKAIHMDDVHNIGHDAVIVPNAAVIKPIKQLGDTVRSISSSNKHLVKTNVLTTDGKDLGRVTDIYFDSESGKVEMLEVSQGGLKTMTEGKKSIKPADIVTIGADATIVSTYTELKLEAQGEEGGLKGMINDTRDKAAQLAAETKESVQEAAEKTAAKAREVSASAQHKAGQFQERATVTAGDIRDVAVERAAELEVRAEDLRKRSNGVSKDAQDKAAGLATLAKEKAREIQATSQARTAEAKRKIAELTDEAQERISDGTEKLEAAAADTRRSGNRAAAAVVEKSSRRYENGGKVVTTKKTVVKK